MLTITFENPVPSANEDAAIGVIWYASIDGGSFAELGRSLLSEIQMDTVTGQYIWQMVNADPAQYQLIKTYSAAGVQSFVGSLLPPLPPNPSLQNLFGYVKELGTAWANGDEVAVRPMVDQTANGALLTASCRKTVVSSNGIFTLLVDKGARVMITIGTYFSKEITITEHDTRDITEYLR